MAGEVAPLPWFFVEVEGEAEEEEEEEELLLSPEVVEEEGEYLIFLPMLVLPSPIKTHKKVKIKKKAMRTTGMTMMILMRIARMMTVSAEA